MHFILSFNLIILYYSVLKNSIITNMQNMATTAVEGSQQ